MKTRDVLKFLDYKIDDYTARAAKNRAEYEIYRERWEGRFLCRLFRIRHEISLWDQWAFIDLEYYARELTKFRFQAIYNHKSEIQETLLPKDYREMFYKWAFDNNVPY